MPQEAIKEAPRPLNKEEEDLLRFLLSEEFPGVEVLRSQVEYATVTSRCGCGCPTVGFTIDKSKTQPAPFHDDMPVEGLPQGSDTDPAVLLFVRDGYLDWLELMWFSDQPPARWPAPSSLKINVR